MALAEDILINGASEILKKLIAAVGSEIIRAWGVKDDLKRLKQTLEVIAAVTSDAERKQLNDAAVKVWLKRLKHVSYDAEDVLDEFAYEALRRFHKNSKVKDFFSSTNNQIVFRFKMARKIKGINIQFDRIATDMQRFQFQTNSLTSGGYEQQNKRLTTSFFGDVSKFVGREEDKTNIIKMLTTMSSSSFPSTSSVNSNTHEKVSVISIVGMGGLGKTSLAQSIYNDKSVKTYFGKKMWVCISDEFDVYKILQNIMESATGSGFQDFSNTDVLVQKVRENLEGTKYLLVLDDLWNEDPMEWNKLKSILDFGSVGSKIIVTTRCQGVASVVQGSIPPYNLDVLSEADCWFIIKNKAFSPGGASKTGTMTVIGEQIARKCGGLPLAANFFGCLMHSQSNETHWLSIRDNKSLETRGGKRSGGILPILKLSYDILPSHLKQCFSYCCLFPKDWRYNRETLIRLWIARGFVHPSNGGNQNSLEDIGNDYFHSLLSSSFFQDLLINDFGDIIAFKMHDLVHDLALSVMENEVMILDTSVIRSEGIPKNAEKLQKNFHFPVEGFVFPSPQVTRNKRLRVIYQIHNCKNTSISSSTFKFKHMRYLDLSFLNLEDVHAESIHQLYNLQTLKLCFSKNVQKILKEGFGCLINLRHLDLSCSDANLLPDCITKLTNLQSLDISNCGGFSVLPTNIGHLQNLSSLDISWTDISEFPDSISLLYNLTKLKYNYKLKSLPLNFGALTQLRSLNLYNTQIRELPESLTSNICKLEFVDFGTTCKYPENIKNWVELRSLEYWGSTDGIIMPGGIENLSRLEVLQPYMVSKEDDVSMDTCGYNSTCSSIHELADLNSLRTLWIYNLENVRGGKIEAERAKFIDKKNIQELNLEWKNSKQEEEEVVVNNSFMVLEGLQPHPYLEKLKIKGFPGLKIPKWIRSYSCLPNLVELRFDSCKSCTILAGLGQLPYLRILKIEGMSSVKCLGEEFYYQQEEDEEDESKGSAISTTRTTTTLFPSLTRLCIDKMENLEEWFAPDNSFPCLVEIEIYECGNLTSIPDLRLWTSSLKKLSIQDCEKLEKESMEYYLDKFLPSVKYRQQRQNYMEGSVSLGIHNIKYQRRGGCC